MERTRTATSSPRRYWLGTHTRAKRQSCLGRRNADYQRRIVGSAWPCCGASRVAGCLPCDCGPERQPARRLCGEAHCDARAARSSRTLGQSWRVAGSKSAPFGHTSVPASASSTTCSEVHKSCNAPKSGPSRTTVVAPCTIHVSSTDATEQRTDFGPGWPVSSAAYYRHQRSSSARMAPIRSAPHPGDATPARRAGRSAEPVR